MDFIRSFKIDFIKDPSSQTPVFTRGIQLMILSTFGFTGMQVMIKELSDFHFTEVVFFRSLITALLCMFYLFKNGLPIIGKQQGVLFLRAIVGILSMTCFFITVQRIPLGASISLKYLSPVFTAVFAVLFLKEEIRWLRWIFFFTAVLGVLLLKGFDLRIDTLNFTLGLVGALLGGLVYVIIRYIGDREHPMVIVNYFMLTAAILSGIAMIPFWKTPSLYEAALLLSLGVFGYFGQIYMTKAFQLEKASRVVPIKYLEMVYALVIGFFWYEEGYTLVSFIGILLIIGSMVMNVIIKR